MRDRVLAAGITEFAEHDYAGASLERLAEAAETTKPMVHYYFGSKAGLYRTALDHLSNRLQAAIAQRTEDLTSPPEILHATVLAALDTEEADHGALRLLDRSPPPRTAERVPSLLAGLLREVLRRILAPLVTASPDKDERAETDMGMIAAALAGTIRSLDPGMLKSAAALDARARAIAGMLWQGLASRTTGGPHAPPHAP